MYTTCVVNARYRRLTVEFTKEHIETRDYAVQLRTEPAKGHARKKSYLVRTR